MVINGKTKLIGVLGDPIEHSFSPFMHNTVYEKLGLNYAYLPLKVEKEQLGQAIEGLRALGFIGVNVTIPHKENIMQYLKEVSKEAELMGAVNTIVLTKGGYIGENTDGKGFLKSLKEEGFDPKNKKVIVLGAGGAARAVAVSLALEGVDQVCIINRTREKGEKIAQIITEKIGVNCTVHNYDDKLDNIFKQANLIVNTTSLGMHPDVDKMPPLNPTLFSSNHLVVDLIYNPEETKLLKLAKQQNAKTLNGLGMLIYQGEYAFKMWIPEEEVDFKKILDI
ncbi:shikimate dehydrogenase [Desulfonispora thiosulfatigenes DSM 11270]|uniref:Shikimate dehydrogenase (NADP(+)) n=1 Tax=Desulfonispora thiosulfatigenes DSM 11270 TaxID=656914 RepID=A0A1W1V7F0_DESTI|nr:shikimate dehydrogenase [Desulfonispora thiosulfatigenes]SMB89213.1 shikimate dehydrogenase [Desulfonispora thiosulfatigenes DSM 11270]